MVTNVLQSKSVQRLQGILKSRYGKGLEVRYVMDSSMMGWNSQEATVVNGDLIVPINLHGVFLGMARIPAALDLPSSSIQAITEVVRLILEPNLYGRYLDNRATQLKNEIEDSGQDHELGLVGEEIGKEVGEDSAGKASLALLVSDSPHNIARAARLLHETTERWAFLSYSDMKCQLGSVSEIKALGNASIFIEDLLLMSPEELEVLTEFLKVADFEQDPMIIIGSTRSFEQIQSTGHYPESLIEALAPYVADLSRWPAEERAIKQALEMLIQPLALSGL